MADAITKFNPGDRITAVRLNAIIEALLALGAGGAGGGGADAAGGSGAGGLLAGDLAGAWPDVIVWVRVTAVRIDGAINPAAENSAWDFRRVRYDVRGIWRPSIVAENLRPRYGRPFREGGIDGGAGLGMIYPAKVGSPHVLIRLPDGDGARTSDLHVFAGGDGETQAFRTCSTNGAALRAAQAAKTRVDELPEPMPLAPGVEILSPQGPSLAAVTGGGGLSTETGDPGGGDPTA